MLDLAPRLASKPTSRRLNCAHSPFRPAFAFQSARRSVKRLVEINGVERSVPSASSICGRCGDEQSTKGTSRAALDSASTQLCFERRQKNQSSGVWNPGAAKCAESNAQASDTASGHRIRYIRMVEDCYAGRPVDKHHTLL